MDFKHKNILIISPEPWGINHVSKHHFALELANYGAVVYFLDPPGKKDLITQISQRLTVVKYKTRLRGLNKVSNGIRKLLLQWQINNILKLIGKPIHVVWSFDPFRFQDINLFKSDYAIFHSVDYIDTKWDLYIAGRADLVLTTSEKILKRYQNIEVLKYNIGHGLSNFFLNPTTRASISVEKNSQRIAVGYCGNLLMKYIDRNAFTKIIRENQDLDFYFIGPYTHNNLTSSISEEATRFVEFLKNQTNCFLLGPMPASHLYWYLLSMDILLVCYKPDSIANPHKILEYLSSGKVVVSNYMPEFETSKDLIEMSRDNEDLPGALFNVARRLDKVNNKNIAKARIEFAKNRSYKKKIAEIERLLKETKLPE